MVCVGHAPPVMPSKNAAAYQEGNWSSLDWDATEQEVERVENVQAQRPR